MKSHSWFTFIAGLLGSLFSPSIERQINKYLKVRQSTSLLKTLACINWLPIPRGCRAFPKCS